MSSHLLNQFAPRTKQSGATLVESMIALSLFAGLSASVFPLFTLSRKTLKQSSLRGECQRIVDLKLAQYRQGLIQDFRGTLDLGARSITGRRYGQGFWYAAKRYNDLFPDGICSGTGISTASSSLWSGRVLGVRECIEANDFTSAPAAWKDSTTADESLCSSHTDQAVRNRIPGFKLYVRLTRSSPWVTPPSTPTAGGDNPAARQSADCPQSLDDDPTAPYAFTGAQDGIQVTVTAIVDATNTILSPNERQCQATTLLEPVRLPFRYFMRPDGRIYDVSGVGGSGLAADAADEDRDAYWNFREVTSTVATADTPTERGMPIRSFSVHPLNRSIWLLRAGLLTRYSDCSGTRVECAVAPVTSNGISDTGANRGSWPSVQNFTVSDSIQSIAVDYLHNRVYAVTQATHDSERALGTTPRGRGLYRIALAGSPETDLPAVTTETADTELVSLAAEGSSGLAADVPFFIDDRFPDRVLGMFTNPAADTAFVIAPYTAPEWDSTQNVTGVFLGTDYRLLTPIAVFPEKIIGFSP